MGGFIVGFDSDDARIFERQIEFVDRAAIPWAMTGVLQAPPTTALFDRLLREGRIQEDSDATSNFSAPNFLTALPLDVLLGGLRRMLLELYEPKRFFSRAIRSLECWEPTSAQHAPMPSIWYQIRIAISSMWHQGVRASYRREYWRFVATVFRRWRSDPLRVWKASVMMLSAEHFVHYARQTADELERRCHAERARANRVPVVSPHPSGHATPV
jgi:hypothetical protein